MKVVFGYETYEPDSMPSKVPGMLADFSDLNQCKWKTRGLTCVYI